MATGGGISESTFKDDPEMELISDTLDIEIRNAPDSDSFYMRSASENDHSFPCSSSSSKGLTCSTPLTPFGEKTAERDNIVQSSPCDSIQETACRSVGLLSPNGSKDSLGRLTATSVCVDEENLDQFIQEEEANEKLSNVSLQNTLYLLIYD